MLIGTSSYGQKTFELTVYIDSSIDPKRLQIYCENGFNTSYPVNSLDNNNSIVRGKFYSRYVTVTMAYDKDDSTRFYHQFWISDKPASIRLEKKGNKSIFEDSKLKNSIDIFKENKKLLSRLQNYTKRELNEMSAIWDSVEVYQKRNIFDSLERKCFISLLNQSSRYIRNNNDSYFYFWYFIDQFYEIARISHKKDTTLFLTIRDSLLSIFPKKYIESFETRKILNEIENDIHPKINVSSPTFKAISINGNLVDLVKYKGKYVLLDFWATWCPPCIKQLPFVKNIRSKYDSSHLQIISVSLDHDSIKLISAIREKDLNWIHILDSDNSLSNKFNVKSIPVLILINKEGLIEYNSSVDEDNEKLIELLDGESGGRSSKMKGI